MKVLEAPQHPASQSGSLEKNSSGAWISRPMLSHVQQQPPPQQPSPIPPPPPPPQTIIPQDLTLAGVLHFLQTEWRRYERDRNEWEIERAEMRARIALLEGERRSFENVKLDLMRRIKMLEYALRVERTKQLSQPANQPSKPFTTLSLIQKDDQIPKEGSGSSSPHSEDSPLPADPRLSIASLSLTNGMQKGAYNIGLSGNMNVNAAALGKPPPGRDPKSRARSRDYLKQCLQEITYLTSPQAMNPLPNRPLLNATNSAPAGSLINTAPPALPLTLPNLPSFEPPAPYSNGRDSAPTNSFNGSDASTSNAPFSNIINGRPRKVVPEVGKDFPLLGSKEFPVASASLPNSGKPYQRGAIPLNLTREPDAQGRQQIYSEKDSQVNGTESSTVGASTSGPTPSGLERSNTLPPRVQTSFDRDRDVITNLSGRGLNDTLSSTEVGGVIPSGLQTERDQQREGEDGASASDEAASASQLTTAPTPIPANSQLTDLFREPAEGHQQEPRQNDEEPAPNQSTAIFRPDDAGKWKEQLRLANELVLRASQPDGGSPIPFLGSISGGLSQLGSWDSRLREFVDEDEAMDDESVGVGLVDGEDGGKIWKPKRTLRNHLDVVRAIAFHPTDMCLATGSDDCTVKIWRLDVASLASTTSRPTTEIEPQITLRGHTAPITRLVHSPSRGLVFSASFDSTIRVWALPSHGTTTYAPYDSSRDRGQLVGHTDVVWDITLVRDESLLVSCGAEGSVKVWDVGGPTPGPGGPPGSLKLSWGYAGLGVDPHPEDVACTAVEGVKTDLKKVAVAFRDAVVKLFDLETGLEVGRFNSDASSDGSTSGQVNKIVSHPTMPLLVTAHEDKYIRLFDITTGQCTHSMLSHLDGVTSLSIDPSGFSLVSGGHDCSVRFWDLLNKRTCVQEITSHRKKADEGVLDVEFHPALPFMASAGADGVVKLYASS